MFTHAQQELADEELASILGIGIDDESEREAINADPGPSREQAIAGMEEIQRFRQSLPAWPPGWIS